MMLIDGKPGGSIEASDRGLHYGDGLFETMAVFGGRAPLWDYHMDRLAAGCRQLALPVPDRERLEREVRQVSAGNDRAVVKIVLTRGPGGRGFRPPVECTPTRLVQGAPWLNYPPSFWTQGVRVRFCETRLGGNPRLAGLKHLNRLEQVLARAEWRDEEITEGLMLDLEGNVIEGTMTNVFVVCEDQLLTPGLATCGVAGVMRRAVLEAAERMGMKSREAVLTAGDLMQAEEVFLTNALVRIWPVARLEARPLPGAQGKITRRLTQALEEQWGPW